MPSLLEAQSQFASELLGGGGAAGMAVYRANVYGNWTGALAAAYPIMRKIVGGEFFQGLARAYADAHPSASGDLNEYGARMAEFVASFRHTQDLPYLPDVARMEWLAHLAYYAADRQEFRAAHIDDAESLSPRLAPACALLESPWPLGRIWTVHQDDYEGEIAVDLGAGPDRVLIHRPRWRVQARSLAAGDHVFLTAVRSGLSLGEALEAALAEDPDFDPSSALARWVDAGVLIL